MSKCDGVADNSDEDKTAAHDSEKSPSCPKSLTDDATLLNKAIGMKIIKKHVCSKCGKSYSQKSLLTQHFDYQHTNKPKRFVCEPCGKSFELKKSLQEHNHQLHSESTGKYLCDFCSRSFYHFGEFTVHRASHTGLKPSKCGRCLVKSFASSDHLNKHLLRCGNDTSLVCNKCGKGYSNGSTLATHIWDVHEKDNVRNCSFCDKQYNSEGGYYQHLRIKHDISRSGKKLSSALIEKLSQEERKGNGSNSNSNDISEDEQQSNSKSTANKGSASKAEQKNDEGKNINEDTTLADGNKSEKESTVEPMELSHTCPFPKCNDLVLINDEAYYKHLWDVHKLGRNK